MSGDQRPTINDQDWQRLREALEDQAKAWESHPLTAPKAEGMRSALRYMDAVESDASRVRGRSWRSFVGLPSFEGRRPLVSDLSQSLVDAAAEALRQAGFVDPDDDTMPTFFPIDSGMPEQGAWMDVWKPVGCAAEVAAAAALETLADKGRRWSYLDLRALAAGC